jgi:DNA modification methylase
MNGTDNKEFLKLQKEYEKLKAENADLKKRKKFGLVWEEQSLEKNIDDKEHYPFLAKKGEGFGFDNGETKKNILIEGDNYHALEILQYTHKGAVDIIYIDPPYNTGKKKEFRYNDHWVDKEDGYRHSKWLSFMDKRLRLAKELLKKEGVILISIDDNEQARLKLLCDDVFGSKNWLETFIWNTEGNIDNQKKIKGNHEYVLAYAKNEDFFSAPAIIDPNIGAESKLYNDTIENSITKNGPKNPMSDIILPVGFPTTIKEGVIKQSQSGYPTRNMDINIENYKITNEVTVRSGWSSKNLLLEFIENEFNPIQDGKEQDTWFKITATGAIYVYKERTKDQSHVLSVLTNFGTTKKSSEDLKRMGVSFGFPKPIGLVQHLIKMTNSKTPVILDFFAGSGTTGHAVMDLAFKEREREYNPQFILVTNNENNICEEVCYERLKKANEINRYNSNVEYLKAELLEYDPERHGDMDIRAFMIEKLTEIIKVRESCFSLTPINNNLQKFDRDDKSVYILHNVYEMGKKEYENAIQALQADEQGNIHIYILAMSNHSHYAQKLSKSGKTITFEPLPENFLKLLRKIDTNIRRAK